MEEPNLITCVGGKVGSRVDEVCFEVTTYIDDLGFDHASKFTGLSTTESRHCWMTLTLNKNNILACPLGN